VSAFQARPSRKSKLYSWCKDCSNERRRFLCLSKPEQTKSTRLAKFGLTLTQYYLMLIDQSSCCKICGAHKNNVFYGLVVDHDHSCCPKRQSCGKCVRGLLCSNCNTGIGILKENPEVLRKAAKYIEDSLHGR